MIGATDPPIDELAAVILARYAIATIQSARRGREPEL
jgi:DNA-directed RNA polymerase subunit K/omega